MSVHTVYINERPLIFFPVYDAAKISASNMTILSESEVDRISMVEMLEQRKSEGIYCLSENPDRSWLSFCDAFDLIVAAGGLVRNSNGEYLLIFRRGKWDLPKGKLDYDEDPEAAAKREVEEETGIGELEIKSPLPTTFYIYTEKGRRKLKKTFWFLMETTSASQPQPQIEEDIHEARWMSAEAVRAKAIGNTYIIIAEMLRELVIRH